MGMSTSSRATTVPKKSSMRPPRVVSGASRSYSGRPHMSSRGRGVSSRGNKSNTSIVEEPPHRRSAALTPLQHLVTSVGPKRRTKGSGARLYPRCGSSPRSGVAPPRPSAIPAQAHRRSTADLPPSAPRAGVRKRTGRRKGSVSDHFIHVALHATRRTSQHPLGVADPRTSSAAAAV